MKENITIIGPLQVALSALEEKDDARLTTLANNPNIARNLRNIFPHPYTLADAQFFIREAQAGTWGYCWGIHYQGELAGVINLVLRRMYTDIQRKLAIGWEKITGIKGS